MLLFRHRSTYLSYFKCKNRQLLYWKHFSFKFLFPQLQKTKKSWKFNLEMFKFENMQQGQKILQTIFLHQCHMTNEVYSKLLMLVWLNLESEDLSGLPKVWCVCVCVRTCVCLHNHQLLHSKSDLTLILSSASILFVLLILTHTYVSIILSYLFPYLTRYIDCPGI